MNQKLVHDTLIQRLAALSQLEETTGITFVDRKENEQHWTWGQIWDRAERSAQTLLSNGVKSGDRVAIILPTSIEFMDSYFGCQRIGAVAIPLYPPVRLGKLDEYIDKTVAMFQAAQITHLISNKKTRRILGQVVQHISKLQTHLQAEKLHQNDPAEVPFPSADDLAMAQFSSGTTVAPKPVGLTHRQILANVDAILSHIPINDGLEQKGCSWLPLYHDMGLIGCIFPALSVNASMILIPPEVFLARPAIWLRAIARHKCTISPAPNFAYALCVERIKDEELAEHDLSSWWFALNGAEPVSPSVLRAFSERFAEFGLPKSAITPVYGLAEAALAVTFSDPKANFETHFFNRQKLEMGTAEAIEKHPNAIEMASVGIPLPDFNISIRDSSNQPCAPGQIGKIFAKGPSIMEGYLDRDVQPIVEGWLDTGDVGFVHQEELFISGRAKDVIVLRGANHSPHSIENALNGIEGIRTGCSAAVGDITEQGEALIVFAEMRHHRSDLAEDCGKAITRHTGLKADAIILLEAGTLPRTSSGKIRRREALRLWKTGELEPPQNVSPLFLTNALLKSAWGYFRAKTGV
ncbi:MAG: fatty acyl-AMP ligase [Myxococcota bacterium]|nr:fatty acyl-AMP ligase [Myxococcota bacterium]